MAEGSLFIQLNYKGNDKLITVDRSTTVDDIMLEAIGEWNELLKLKVSLTTTGGPLVNCSLKVDKDLQNLLLVCESFGVKFATVNILTIRLEPCHVPAPTRIVVEPELVTPPLVRSNKRGLNRVSEEVDEFVGSGSLPSYGYSPELEKVPLLNDGWVKLITGNGQLFRGGAEEFKDKVIKYTTKLGFNFDFKRNDARYVHVWCTERVEHDCKWFIKAGRQPHNQYFAINKCDLIHGCVGKMVSNKKSRLGAAVLGRLFTNSIRHDPTTMSKDVKQVLRNSYGIEVSNSRSSRTVGFSKGEIFGTYVDSYNNLPWYTRAVKRTNPGSVAELEAEPNSNHFKRVFIAYNASLEAFKTCRPMLFIDGTFMGGRANGIILAATAKDGNNGLVPVAFAVVSAENLDNWKWFLEMLRDNVKHDKDIFFILDRHGGLMSAFPQVFEKPVHFFCLQHLKTNLQKLFGGRGCAEKRTKMWELFKDVAYAPTIQLFEEKMKIFKEEGGVAAAEWIDSLPPENWALAYSSDIYRYGEMTSNAIESFNYWLKPCRRLPVTYMIDSIRMGLMRWFVERREEGAKWKGSLCQHKEEHWNALSEKGATWMVLESTGDEYEVLCGTSVKVNLKERKCGCYQWQIRGFPCAHAVAVIRKVCNNINDVIDPYFFVKTYQKCYNYAFNPIPQTEKFECLPSIANDPPM